MARFLVSLSVMAGMMLAATSVLAGTYTITTTTDQDAEIQAQVDAENARRAAKLCERKESQNPATHAWVVSTDPSVQPSWGRRIVQYSCPDPAITAQDLIQSRAGQIIGESIKARDAALVQKAQSRQPLTDAEKLRVKRILGLP